MKRIVYFLLVSWIILSFFGCNSKPIMLKEDEYYIYENSKPIVALSDYNAKIFFFSNPYFDNDNYEIVLDLEGREITTMRGIKIGSTIREFINAYQYCEIILFDNDIITTAEDFLKNIDDYALGKEYIITMSTHYTLDGQILCNSEWHQYLQDNSIDIADYSINPQNYCSKVFKIDFIVENGIINDIAIWDSMSS